MTSVWGVEDFPQTPQVSYALHLKRRLCISSVIKLSKRLFCMFLLITVYLCLVCICLKKRYMHTVAQTSARRQYLPPCLGDRLPITRRCFSSQPEPAGLWQQYVGWSSNVSRPSTSFGSDSVLWLVYNVAVQTYRALHTDASLYLQQFTCIADIQCRQRLRSSTTDSLSVPTIRLLVVVPFLSLVHVYGTIYLRTLPPHRLCLHLSND